MSKRFLAALCLAIVSCAGIARGQSIEIILDPQAPSCWAIVGPNPFIELHVLAVLNEAIPRFQGAQFRIDGMPDSWNEENVSWVWDASVTLGARNPLYAPHWDPAGPGGIASWSTCQPGVARTTRIGKILIYGAPIDNAVTLQVAGFQLHPQEPPCPAMNQCDAPVFTRMCVEGGSFVLVENGPFVSSSCNITAVEERTWSGVKAMYQ